VTALLALILFLVGALLLALTEKWQRLGDLAARTIVVAD